MSEPYIYTFDPRYISYVLRLYPALLSENLTISDISESGRDQVYILEVHYHDVSGYGYITRVYKTDLIKYPFTLGTPTFTKEFSRELVIENIYNEDSLIRLTIDELNNIEKNYNYALVYQYPSRVDSTSSVFYRMEQLKEIRRQGNAVSELGYTVYRLNNGSVIRIYTYDPTPIIDESGVKSYKLITNYGILYPYPKINAIENYKKAALIIPMDSRDPNRYTLISNNEIVILESEKLTFNGDVSDDAIAKMVVDIWNKNVYGGNLKIGPKQIEYRSPIPNLEFPSLNTPIPPPPPNPNPIPKKKLSFLLPQKPIKVKEDVGLLKVYLGMPTNQDGLPNQEGFVFGNTEVTELDEEFFEDELNATLNALDVEQVSKLQLYDPQTPIYEDEDETQDSVQVATPVNIQPATSLDYIFLTAANYASKTKNKKKLTYYQFRGTNSAQLCGIGARCIAAALLGDESPIKVSGHADWFSFKEKPTQGKHADLSKTGYYQYKTRITVDNYLKDKSKWQIGDVVACGYKNYPWGHIQTWTGVKWCSDFKQNSILNFYKVDPNTFALWRLNEKGVERVKNQLAYYNSLVKK